MSEVSPPPLPPPTPAQTDMRSPDGVPAVRDGALKVPVTSVKGPLISTYPDQLVDWIVVGVPAGGNTARESVAAAASGVGAVASNACTLKLELPCPVGVPEMTPLALRRIPVGS